MPLAAIKANAVSGPTRTYGLQIAGVDVIADPSANGIGIPLGSIHVSEAGPGGVSALEVAVEDAPKLLAFPDGAAVTMYDHVRNVTEFRGYLDTYGIVPWEGGQARTFEVAATGIEALLDWLKIPTVDTGIGGGTNVEYLAAVLTANGFRKAITSGNVSPQLSSLGAPITGYGRTPGDVLGVNATSPGSGYVGLTAREYLMQTTARAVAFDNNLTQAQLFQWTVDMYGGVRGWQDYDGVIPSDYTNLTVSDAGPIRHEGLEWRREPSQIIRAVYVNGSSGASSGWVYDGSGITGRQELISDSSIVTAAQRDAAAQALMRDSLAGVLRGSVTIADWNPPGTVHAGSYITITDAATGLSGATARIMQIDKEYLAGAAARQTWRVSFGSLPPQATTLLRRLTRNVLR